MATEFCCTNNSMLRKIFGRKSRLSTGEFSSSTCSLSSPSFTTRSSSTTTNANRNNHNNKKSSDIQLATEEERENLVLTSNSNKNEVEKLVDDCDELSFIVDYIGSDYVSEAQSVPLLMETLKRIKKQHHKTIRVDLVLKSGILKVIDNEQRGALLITAPLYAIALAAQERLRGFETAFALNITRRRIHMCHVFQAGSRLEVRTLFFINFTSLIYTHYPRIHSTSF